MQLRARPLARLITDRGIPEAWRSEKIRSYTRYPRHGVPTLES